MAMFTRQTRPSLAWRAFLLLLLLLHIAKGDRVRLHLFEEDVQHVCQRFGFDRFRCLGYFRDNLVQFVRSARFHATSETFLESDQIEARLHATGLAEMIDRCVQLVQLVDQRGQEARENDEDQLTADGIDFCVYPCQVENDVLDVVFHALHALVRRPIEAARVHARLEPMEKRTQVFVLHRVQQLFVNAIVHGLDFIVDAVHASEAVVEEDLLQTWKNEATRVGEIVQDDDQSQGFR